MRTRVNIRASHCSGYIGLKACVWGVSRCIDLAVRVSVSAFTCALLGLGVAGLGIDVGWWMSVCVHGLSLLPAGVYPQRQPSPTGCPYLSVNAPLMFDDDFGYMDPWGSGDDSGGSMPNNVGFRVCFQRLPT